MTTGRINQVGQPLLRNRPEPPEGSPNVRLFVGVATRRPYDKENTRLCGQWESDRSRHEPRTQYRAYGRSYERWYQTTSCFAAAMGKHPRGALTPPTDSYRNVSEDVAYACLDGAAARTAPESLHPKSSLGRASHLISR